MNKVDKNLCHCEGERSRARNNCLSLAGDCFALAGARSRNDSFIFLVIILVTLFWATASWAQTSAQQLTKILGSIHTMQAKFQQYLFDGHGRLLQRSTGKMALKRPNKFLWDIKSPNKQELVADGKKLWNYDAGLRQVTVRKLKRIIYNTPAFILTGPPQLLNHTFKINKITQHKTIWFVLKPRANGNSFKQIKIKFIGNHLKGMQLVDALGQRSQLKFYHVKVNQKVSPKLFYFTPPKGVDVVGEGK